MITSKGLMADAIKATHRAKEKRAIRRATLGKIHMLIIHIGAGRFGISESVAEACLVNSDGLEIANKFIASKTQSAAMGIYEEDSALIYCEPADARLNGSGALF
ncbi:hypothetical protein FGIG_00256 [Fasciola gigantica]|uniref:Uncharacterized protein n=1 Tax=Fasciola gigantica TaxID=46835 RepID=A0A504YEP9_FASGI|nr:hypothetical protein FGIG_00256 [Fasciola gigantica]